MANITQKNSNKVRCLAPAQGAQDFKTPADFEGFLTHAWSSICKVAALGIWSGLAPRDHAIQNKRPLRGVVSASKSLDTP